MTRRSEDTGLLGLWQEACEGEGEGLRRLVEHLVQRILGEEVSVFLGAQSYERTDERRGYRNGYKPRVLKTRVGKLELQVPKDREGRFQTELFERYQRSEKALLAAIAQMYVQGVSTRKVKAITEELCGLEISRTQVSEMTKELDEEIAIWRSRPLEEVYPYLVLDARYEKVRRGRHVVSEGVLVAVGISEKGYREILGVWTADTESEPTWSDVFGELRERGLRGVRYIVSDDHKGLRLAIDRYFQGALWQRCQVHFIRNILARVRKGDRARVLELLRGITRACDLETAQDALKRAVEVLRISYPEVAGLLEECGEEILTVYQIPAEHRKKMCSTNMLERVNQEIRRRTRVVRIFPDDASCVRLVSSLAVEINEEWMGRQYLDMGETQELTQVQQFEQR